MASYSQFLSQLFSGFGCCTCKSTACTRRDTAYVTVDIKGSTIRIILGILHSGTAEIKNKKQEEQVRQALDLLGINLKGELDAVICQKKDITETPSLCHSVAYYDPAKFKLKQIIESNETDPVSGQLNMAEQLSEITMDCVMQGCEENVSLQNMTSHFRQHIIQKETSDCDEQTFFSCIPCKKKFPLRRALDNHNKKYHTTRDPSEDTLELESEQGPVTKRRKIDMNNFVERFSKVDTTKDSMNSIQPSETTEEVQRGKEFESLSQISDISDESFLSSPEIEKPNDSNKNSEDEEELNYHFDKRGYIKFKSDSFFGTDNDTSLSFPQNQSCLSNKEKKVLVKSRKKSSINKKTKTKQPNPWTVEKKSDKTCCQICQEKFETFAKLKTHYTREHYWFKLHEQYARFEKSCYICMKKYPTTDHLLQHMGNFHTALTLDQYLLSEGREILTIEWTVKLLNPRCPFPSCTVEGKTSAQMKDHLATKHFASELKKEFPAEQSKNIRCAKCAKTFKNKSLRIGHIGAFHDEVLKYAGDIIEVDCIDRNIIPINDFTDGSKGEDIEEDDTKEPSHLLKVEIDSNPTLFEGSIKEEEVFLCSVKDCVEECSSKQNYALHLYHKHYMSAMMNDFENMLENDPGRCPMCKKDSEEWGGNKDGTLQHIAVDHEYVMKYFEKDCFPISLDYNIMTDIKKEETQESSPLLFDDTISLLETDSDGVNTP